MVIRDSLSKCDTYSNPFDTRNYPIRSRQALAPPAKTIKDVLEIADKDLKREALNHLDSAASRIPSGLYVVVCRVGKVTFLALALPPYLLIYSIPKWILTNFIPLIINKTLQPIQSFFKFSYQKMSNLMKFAAYPFAHAWIGIKVRMGRLNDFFKQRFNKIKMSFRLLSPSNTRFLKEISARFVKMRQGIKNWPPRSFFKFRIKTNEWKSALFKPAAFVKQVCLKYRNQFLSWINGKNAELRGKLRPIFQSSQKNAERISNSIVNVFSKPIHDLKSAAAWIKQSASSGKKLFDSWIASLSFPIVNSYQEKLKLCKKNISQFLAPFKQIGSALSDAAKKYYKQLSGKRRNMTQKVLCLLPRGLQGSLRMQWFFSLLKHLISFLKMTVLLFAGLIKGVYLAAVKIPLLLKSGLLACKNMIRASREGVAPILHLSGFVLGYLIKKSIYWMLIGAILFGYLIYYSFRLASESANTLIGRLRA